MIWFANAWSLLLASVTIIKEVICLYGLLIVSILSASLYSILLHNYPADEKENIYKLNFFSSLVWILLLFFANGCTVHLNTATVLWGVAYGTVQALFILFKAKAMHTGSVSVTTLIGNSSLLVSIVFSSIVWGETISFWDICGLGLLLLGIVLSTYKKSTAAYNKKWKYYAVAFFLLAAGVGILFKAYGKAVNGDHTGDMMLVSAAVMAVFYLCTFATGKEHTLPFAKKKFFLYALGAGVLSCLYNRLNITLSAALDAVIFFPAFNGGVVVASGLLSSLIYKERFSKRQIAGFILGVWAICMIGVL